MTNEYICNGLLYIMTLITFYLIMKDILSLIGVIQFNYFMFKNLSDMKEKYLQYTKTDNTPIDINANLPQNMFAQRANVVQNDK